MLIKYLCPGDGAPSIYSEDEVDLSRVGDLDDLLDEVQQELGQVINVSHQRERAQAAGIAGFLLSLVLYLRCLIGWC